MQRCSPLAILLLCAAVGTAGAAAIAQGVQLPDAPGKQQLLDKCTRCHGVDIIAAQPRSPDQWTEVVSIMIGHGTVLTDAEYDQIVAYLSANVAPQETAAK